MSKSFLFIAMAVLSILLGCATDSQNLRKSMYKVELKQISKKVISISVIPNLLAESSSRDIEQYKNVWRAQAKLACHDGFAGDASEEIIFSSGSRIRVSTTTSPNSEPKTEKTRLSNASVKLVKVTGIANCK